MADPLDDPRTTKEFIAANPHLLDQAERLWQVVRQELIDELVRVGLPFGRQLERSDNLDDLLADLQMTAERNLERLRMVVRGPVPIGGADIQDLTSGTLDVKAEARRIMDVFSLVKKQIYYVVTHPHMFNEYALCTMVGLFFGRILTLNGVVYPISTESVLRLTSSLLQIFPPTPPQTAP